MKYIKTFENNSKDDIIKLSKHTCKTFTYTLNTNEYIEIDYQYDSYRGNYNFFNNMYSDSRRSYLFSFSLIDYYPGDDDRYFESIMPKNYDYLFELEINIIEFMKMITKKYTKHQNMISFTSIQNMINDINLENFNIFVETKKYNL